MKIKLIFFHLLRYQLSKVVKLKNCINPRKKARKEKKLWPIPFLKRILWFWRISEQFGGLAKVAIEPVVPFALVFVFVIFLLRKWKQPLLGYEKAHASSISQIHHLHQLFWEPRISLKVVLAFWGGQIWNLGYKNSRTTSLGKLEKLHGLRPWKK